MTVQEAAVANSLNWVGDGDDISVVRSLEEIFEISFSGTELASLTNVGGFHDLILQKLLRTGDAGKCASAMAFYRLRRALAVSQPDMQITPATTMRVFSTPYVKEYFRNLERQTGLRLGGPAHTWVGWIGEACVLLPLMLVLPLLACSLLVHISPYLWAGLICLLPVGFLLLRFDPGHLAGTVGDLARKAARLNYGRLVKQGAQAREAEIWDIFTSELAVESRLKPQEITRETVFFDSQLKAA